MIRVEVARAFGGDKNDRERAVGLQAVVEQAERLRDHAGRQVLLHVERLRVHHRHRVAIRVPAHGDRDAAEVLSRPAEALHPESNDQCDAVGRTDDAERPLELILTFREHLAGPRTATGRTVARAPHDGDVDEAELDRRARKRDRRRTGAAAVVLRAEPLEVRDADDARHLHLGRRLPDVACQAFDVVHGETGVPERAQDGERAGVPLGHADVLRVGQAVHAGDDRLPILVPDRHSAAAISSAYVSAPPCNAISAAARLRYRCASISHVKPMPP